MERREFLRQAAVGAAGLMLTEPEKEIVDSRLTQKVTCAFKATALSDLCEKLKADTGVQLTAGPSVADEKVTLFCEKLSLREVMRQLSRPFGYTWLRSGQAFRRSGVQALGESAVGPNAQRPTPNAPFRYELVQDLRSQLLEEELRNRDRNAALLALERALQRYRPFLELSPDEARARARQAAPEEKRLLETLAGANWGALKLYFRLSPQQLAALRSGQELTFSQEPQPGEQPLPPDLIRGVLETVQRRVLLREPGWELTKVDDPAGLPLTVIPEARALVTMRLSQTEPGRFSFEGNAGFRHGFNPRTGGPGGSLTSSGPAAVGQSSAVIEIQNRAANAALAADPALGRRLSFRPRPCHPPTALAAEEPPVKDGTDEGREEASPAPGVTSADVLEALHHATGLPVVADFFTHLYAPGAVSVHDRPGFDALNDVADAMRLRWKKEDKWLQLRSVTFYDDRVKEVPNRLLARWSASRRQPGRPAPCLTLDDLCEIAQLSDAQLDAESMAEGARVCWGLAEWDLSRQRIARAHFRFLAQLTPAQRQGATRPTGLTFREMTLAQQQRFLALPYGFLSDKTSSEEAGVELSDLAEAALRVTYRQPGGFCCQVLAGVGRPRIRFPVERMLRVHEATRPAALQAARQIDPQVDAAQIVPAELAVTLEYRWDSPHATLNGVALHATPEDAHYYFLRKSSERDEPPALR